MLFLISIKVETTNGSQIIFTNHSEQNNLLKSTNQESLNQGISLENNSNILKPKVQNYFSTERTYYLNNKNESQMSDKGRQYNTIDQIGQKESIDAESYRVTDIRNQTQSVNDGNKIKSRSMFSTIDCTSIDEQIYEGESSSNQKQQFYYNLKATKHHGGDIQSKSLDNSRRSSMIPIAFNSKRQSLNAIVTNQPNYTLQNQVNNSQNYNVIQYNRSGPNQLSSSIQNYMPFAQQQQQQFISKKQKQNSSVNSSMHNVSQNSNVLQTRSPNLPNNTTSREVVDENQSNQLKDQLSRFQHKIVKFNLNNTQLKHISILEAIKPLLEGREIFRRIGGNQHGSGTSTVNQHKNQYNPFSLENATPDQCGYVLRVAHLNRHLTKIEFKNYQFGQKGQKQVVHSLDTSISVDHMLRVVVPPTTLDLIKFQKHFDVIGNQNTNNNCNVNSSQLYASTTMNTYNTLKQNDQSFVNNTNISFSNNNQTNNNYFTVNSNVNGSNGNNVNGTMTNYSNLSMIHDQNLKMDKILNGNLYPFQIIMDKGNRLDLIAEGYETYRIWVNSISTLIKHRKALNQIKTKIEFIIL